MSSKKSNSSGEAPPYNGEAHGELYSPEYALHIKTDDQDHNKNQEHNKEKEAEAKSIKERDKEINRKRSLNSPSKL
ncbi:hypothetical protein MIMGU_mgv1a017443mg [Erythranthe guttata]|uniref:Uncharacterized protein n=1 Tax=Erythranthe guttata TaxID=4155 RepID=A0A022Q3X8_ERYGU|nr:hypothetical protein MIMGU_mgv1a017443mg [Erythranthe guttata]